MQEVNSNLNPQEILHAMGVLIDPGDNRPPAEILTFLKSVATNGIAQVVTLETRANTV